MHNSFLFYFIFLLQFLKQKEFLSRLEDNPIIMLYINMKCECVRVCVVKLI